MKLSVRIKLRTPEEAYCSFVVSGISFLYPPNRGDIIILNFDDCEDFITRVSHNLHYCTEPSAVVVYAEDFRCKSYDSMLLMFDMFKSTYPIESFDSSDKEPETYYVFYRNIIKMLGISSASPTINATRDNIKVLAECCRSIILGELYKEGIESEAEFDKAYSTYNPLIKELHNIVINEKLKSDNVLIFDIIREWEPLINNNKVIKWDADFDIYVRTAHMVFSRVKSLDKNKYPEILK